MTMFSNIGRFAGSCLIILALSACSSMLPKTDADAKVSANHRYNQLMRVLQESRAKQAKQRTFFESTPWLVGKSVVEPTQYPELKKKPIVLSEYDKRLQQILPDLSTQGDVIIRLSPDLYGVGLQGNAAPSNGAHQSVGTDSAGTPSLNVLTQAASGGGGSNDELDDPLKQRISFTVNGTLDQALNEIAGQLGISWRYDKAQNKVTFYRLAVRTFQIFFPGGSNTSVDTGGSASSQHQDDVISQKSQFQFDGGSWKEVQTGINALLTPWGHATIIRSTGNVVVKDTPDAIKRVQKYVQHINDIYGRQVYLEIKTATVNMDDVNQFDVDWKQILNTINGGKFQLGLDGQVSTISGAPTKLNVIRPKNGAQLALQLLATKANSTQTNDQSITTLSNQPATIKVLVEHGYIKNISQQDTNTTINNNVISSVNTSTVNTGFDATFIPRVINKKKIQLQVALELSGNLKLTNFDTTIVQTPTRDRDAVTQRQWLTSGETWVIAAFNSNQTTDNRQGAGSPNFVALGGGKSAEKKGQVLLVMVTPYIEDGVDSQ